MITDLRLSSLDKERPYSAAPLGRAGSRDDSRPSFDLLLKDQRGRSADGPNFAQSPEKPCLPDRPTSERNCSDTIAERDEVPARNDGNEGSPTNIPSADAVEADERPTTPSTSTKLSNGGENTAADTTAGNVEPLVPADHEATAGDGAAAGGTSGIVLPPPAEVIGAGKTDLAAAMPPSGAVSLAGEAPRTEPAPDDAAAPQPMTADELAASLALTIAPLSTPTNPTSPATMPNAGGAVGIATTSATIMSGAAAPALTAGSAPGSDGSTPVQVEPGETPAQEGNPASGPFSSAPKKETAFDDPSSRQGQDQGDFSHLAAASAGDASAPGPVSADKPAAPVRPVSEQIAVHMARGAKNGLNHLHIALEPDNLGRLEIRLDFHRDGRLNAAIVADRPETLTLLRNEARALEESLNAAGFTATQDSLSFDLSSSNERAHVFLPEAQARRSFVSSSETTTGEEVSLTTPPWRPISPGRLDIRA